MKQHEALGLAHRLIAFMESARVPEGLFTPDVFCDFTLPTWRLQTTGVEGLVSLRKGSHPGAGRISNWRCDATPTGFVMEFEKEWVHDGKEWYSREIARVDTRNGAISELVIYSSGDWDAERRAQHAAQVKLFRP